MYLINGESCVALKDPLATLSHGWNYECYCCNNWIGTVS